jgi:hypothetical protein
MGRNIYQNALDSQCACNLSGLIRSLPAIADEIWDEIRADEKFMNTSTFNQHPVMRLFAEQFVHLTSGRDYSKASAICERKALLVKCQDCGSLVSKLYDDVLCIDCAKEYARVADKGIYDNNSATL